MTIPYDTSKFVKISIEEVVKILVEAIVLAFLVMYLFLPGLRRFEMIGLNGSRDRVR